jgi:iron complex outermembrane recepter protein
MVAFHRAVAGVGIALVGLSASAQTHSDPSPADPSAASAAARAPGAAAKPIAVASSPTPIRLAEAAAPLDSAAAAPADAGTQSNQNSSSDTSLQEIVVTAQRREQRLSDVPISIQAYTGAMMAQAQVVDATDIAQISPAVTFNSNYSSWATSFSIRGVESVAFDAGLQPSVGVLVDDVPLARQGEVVFKLLDIDRIEVLSGPQGTLFGKNSTAGVVNFIQNVPKHEFSATSEVDATFDEQYTGKLLLNAPVNDKIAVRVNAYYDYLHPLVKNLSGPDQFGDREYGIQGKLLFDITATTNLLFTANYNNVLQTTGFNEPIVPNSGTLGILQQQVFGQIFYGNKVLNQNPGSHEQDESHAFIAELNSELSDRLHLVSITGVRAHYNEFYTNVPGGPVSDIYGTGLTPNPLNYPIVAIVRPNEIVENFTYWSQELRVVYSAPGVNVVAGGFYQNFKEHYYNQASGFLLDGSFALGDPRLAGISFYNSNTNIDSLKDDSYALFGDATVEVMPSVNLFAGLRYTREKLALDYARENYFNPQAGFYDPVTQVNTAPPVGGLAFTDDTRTDNNVSGRAGIQWQPTPNQNYYASYSRGYKGAAANEAAGLTSESAALLAPEIASAYEIGAKERFFENRLAIDLSIYTQKITDIQQTAVVPGSVTTSLVNSGALKTNGFEINLTGRPIAGLTLTAGFVYNNARYNTNASFPCGPSATPGTGVCEANGTFPLNGTFAIGVPEKKLITSAVYTKDIGNDLELTTRVGFDWRSAIQYQLYHDPLNEAPSLGLLEASVGLGSRDDRWQIVLFGKNLTDKFYYAYLNTANNFIGQSFGYFPRDYQRYGGVRLTYRF